MGIHRPKDFEKKITAVMEREFGPIPHGEIRAAVEAAYAEYDHHMKQIREKGAEIIAAARKEGRRIIVLAGRPYHVDPEVNHGIDTLIVQFGAAVITEDSVSQLAEPFKTTVLNQWTYHARLYAAAKYCCTQPDMDLVQLVSFRLRRGRHYHRRDAGDPPSGRQAVHPAENRRDHQSGRSPHPPAEPVCGIGRARGDLIWKAHIPGLHRT